MKSCSNECPSSEACFEGAKETRFDSLTSYSKKIFMHPWHVQKCVCQICQKVKKLFVIHKIILFRSSESRELIGKCHISAVTGDQTSLRLGRLGIFISLIGLFHTCKRKPHLSNTGDAIVVTSQMMRILLQWSTTSKRMFQRTDATRDLEPDNWNKSLHVCFCDSSGYHPIGWWMVVSLTSNYRGY